MIRDGELAGPVAFSRDNLDSGSIVNPTFESEKMMDGGDLISDWPYLNALLNTAAMADLVAIQANYSMGEAVHTGVTMIADGSEEADLRLEACLTTDSGIGVVRHAQAGYEPARQVAEGHGPLTDERIKVPLWWSPEATFGPEAGAVDRLGRTAQTELVLCHSERRHAVCILPIAARTPSDESRASEPPRRRFSSGLRPPQSVTSVLSCRVRDLSAEEGHHSMHTIHAYPTPSRPDPARRGRGADVRRDRR